MDFDPEASSSAPETSRSAENRATGELVVFTRTAAETGGELLEMENHWPRSGHVTPEHAHPGMEERWVVVSGRVAFRIGDTERICGPGERIAAPPGVPHSAHSVGDVPVHLRIQMRPALRWQEFVERLFANEGNPAGLVDLLREFPDEIVVPSSSSD